MKKNILLKKSILAILILAFAALAAVVPVSAGSEPVYVVDETDSISAGDLAELNDYARQASDACGTDILFLLTESQSAAGNDIVGYMQDYPEIGSDEDRIFLASGPDTWFVLCNGKMSEKLTSEQEDNLFEAYNVQDTYYDGIWSYITLAKQYVFDAYPDEGADMLPDEIRSLPEYSRVMDGAGMLTAAERAELTEKFDALSAKYDVDYVVCTVSSLNGKTAEACADDIFDYCGFGIGEERNGVLLLISTGDGKWHISTRGYGITAFTDAGIDYIGGELLSDLKAANYAGAFAKFSDLCDDFTAKAKSGDPYTKYNLPLKPLSFKYAIGALVAGFVIALIAVGSMKSKLKTVRFKAEANSYVRPGSMKVTFARDDFLYHTITSTPIQKNDSSSGGSSTHTSSSGATHGGGGGSF